MQLTGTRCGKGTPHGLWALYGSVLQSDFPFRCLTADPGGKALLSFSVSRQPFPYPASDSLVYVSPHAVKDGRAALEVHQVEPRSWLLTFAQVGTFLLQPEAIHFHGPANTATEMVELYFLGPVMAFWLETHGMLALHSSAVAYDSNACLAFLATSGSGKSCLAATFTHEGSVLLADDILPVDVHSRQAFAHPGVPALRLFPDALRYFGIEPETLPRLQPGEEKRLQAMKISPAGAEAPKDHRLTHIFLPQRLSGERQTVDFELVPRGEALIEVLRHGFASRSAEAAGLREVRLERLARLVNQVPVSHLRYSSGFENLPRVKQEILRYLESG